MSGASRTFFGQVRGIHRPASATSVCVSLVLLEWPDEPETSDRTRLPGLLTGLHERVADDALAGFRREWGDPLRPLRVKCVKQGTVIIGIPFRDVTTRPADVAAFVFVVAPLALNPLPQSDLLGVSLHAATSVGSIRCTASHGTVVRVSFAQVMVRNSCRTGSSSYSRPEMRPM